MDVKLSRLALADLTHIRAYITQFNPAAAERMANRLLAATDRLANHPWIGRPGPADTRELSIVPPYVISYEVIDDEVVILRIWHSAQDR